MRLFQNKIQLFQLVVAVLVVFLALPSYSAIYCEKDEEEKFEQCEAGIESRKLDGSVSFVQGQHDTKWCWAATIEMLFKYYGYIVTQEAIVHHTYGRLVNKGGTILDMIRMLNGQWTDKFGRKFRVVCEAIPARLAEREAFKDLEKDFPVILTWLNPGTAGHAVLLTSMIGFKRDVDHSFHVTSIVIRDPAYRSDKRVLGRTQWENRYFVIRTRVY